jgi:hypothetical protein
LSRKKPIEYSEAELVFIKRNCTLSRQELTDQFNAEFKRDLSKSNLSGLCKRKGWLTGRTGQYIKGNKPYNTGTKGVVKPNSGNFKKGNIPFNHKPVGSHRVNVDGYVEIKIAEPNIWETGARVIWEQNYGPIPDGNIVSHKDNDRLNLDPSNLILLSKAENLFINRHGFQDAQASHKETIKNLARLNVTMFQRLKSKRSI